MFRGTDNLILVGHVEGDAATLEVYIYNDVEDALYVHHDLLLPSFPLALGEEHVEILSVVCFYYKIFFICLFLLPKLSKAIRKIDPLDLWNVLGFYV